MLNVSRWRCDALAVSHHGIALKELPDVTERNVADVTDQYLQALGQLEAEGFSNRDDRLALETTITMTLRWLWDHIAAPVLDWLDYTSVPNVDSPRLWWCPTGALTVLPIHASGYHRSEGDNVYDRVVSSYTPTLRALANARMTGELRVVDKILVVAIANTPAHSPLPGAEAELRHLVALFDPFHRTTLVDGAATRDAVLDCIGTHRWLHAACHGTQNLRSPADGGLFPYDWASSGLVRITDLTSLKNIGGDFAFLSACKTAIGGTTNVDEVISVAAAMQCAGWRHVIGTLWTVRDRTAAAIASDVYARLVHRGTLDPGRSAYALHCAVRSLRDKAPDLPSTWAQYVHMGL